MEKRIYSLMRGAFLGLLAASVLTAQDSGTTLDFQISTETVPAGGMAQIKLFLLTPQPISAGKIVFTFDGGDYPATFPTIEAATVFSASGDVTAIGSVNSFSLPFVFTVWFSSPSGGVGSLAGLPVVEFSIPVTEAFSVDLDLMASSFGNTDGVYSATAKPGGAAVGGELSIRNVTPAGATGILPTGSVLRIEGTGFGAATSVTVDGVSLASVEVVTSNLINVTLAAPAEITAKLIRVRNADGAQIDYWGGLAGPSPATELFLTFPLSTSSSASCGIEGHPGFRDPLHLVLQNPNAQEAEVTITNTVSLSSPAPSTISINIPKGGTYMTNIDDPPDSAFETSSSTPLRSLCFGRTRNPDFELLTWLPVVVQDEPVPSIGWVANAASQQRSGVSPGEIITIYATASGPPVGAGLVLDDSGRVARELNGMRLLFDGIPSPLLYVSNSQANAVVPYEIGASGATTLQLEYNGTRSAEWGVLITAAAPGIFTLDMSGKGQAAVLNQDNSINGASNPAAPGSVIQIFATGEGMTIPGGITGDEANRPKLPVTVSISGVDAPVLYAGSSPGSIAGLVQVNAIVPAVVAVGDLVPLSLTIGSVTSPGGPTIAVQ
jgi:uncharacterized protein (TIGR03437 family)